LAPRAATSDERSDEELLVSLGAGQEDALAPLYQRYAPVIFRMAARALGQESAEDVVQDAFGSVWRHASTFQPDRGAARPWILQIARTRLLNELRRRSRKPGPGPEDSLLEDSPDDQAPPDEILWEDYRRSALRSAMKSLAPPQRQALTLAFLEELTHEEVADALNVPLGTTKTRIRAGMQRLRLALSALAAAAILIAGGTLLVQRYTKEQALRRRAWAALEMSVASDVQVLRLTALPGEPPEAHGTYRSRDGSGVAVVTLSNMPPLRLGTVYQAWLLHQGRWISLGSIVPEPGAERTVLIADAPAQSARPDALQVTVETRQSPAPTGKPVIAWPTR
jgi:RNA polymerase sigma-70 factor (ECF subfamily)